MRARLPIEKVRALIADHLHIDVKKVTDDAHFTEDLGADWLDRLELMTLIEDQFAGLEISDNDVDQIDFVGDLIRYIQTENDGAGLTGIIESRESS
jgi:acyl carrier protein